jgi:cytochrome P450
MAEGGRLFTTGLLADPYPEYHRLRRDSPAYLDPDFNEVLLTRYADCVAVLRHPRLSSRRVAEEGLPIPEAFRWVVGPVIRSLSRQMLFSDPPDHTRLRALASKAFTPRVVDAMRDRIQALTDSLLDGLAAAPGPVDLIREFAQPLPLLVITEMLGVDARDRGRFKTWSEDLALFIGGTTLPQSVVLLRGARGMTGLRRYFRAQVRRRRAAGGGPGTDLLGALMAAEEQGDQLTEEELLANCALLLAAGHETTSNLIGNGVWSLLRHPDQLQALQADPALIEGAVEEVLRFESPVQWTGRVALEEVRINDLTLPAGQRLAVCLGAANRDPAQFPDPDRFDIRRADSRHLAFSHGIHFCLGAALARLEGQVALGTLAARFPNLRAAATGLEWQANFTLRGLKRLPVYLR